MTEVVFLASLQDYQASRIEEISSRLKAERPDLQVRVLSPRESTELLTKHKLKFGPAVLVDGRLEFVGVPRYRMLVDRVAKSTRPAPAAPAPGLAVAAAGNPEDSDAS